MKISYLDLKKICFSEVQSGDVFTNGKSAFYMKTSTIYYCDDDDVNEYVLNAVDLKTGTYHCFDQDALVAPVNCELVIG